VQVGSVKLDLKALLARKDKIVAELTRGVAGLLRKNKVASLQGTARIVSPTEVELTAEAGPPRRLSGKRILIATGSDVAGLPGVAFDGKHIVSSTEALALPKVPKHLIVIGGGVIGLELGSVWLRLGAQVTVVEMLPKLLGPLDRQITDQAQRILTRQGFTFHLNTRVTGVERNGSQVSVAAQTQAGETLSLKGDVLLVAIGRRPYADGLGASEAGVTLDDRGRIVVNEDFRTSVPSIYAIGDVIAGPMLAHKAMDEGVACVERMAGRRSHVVYEAIPWIVYTWPEIAWVGFGEEELIQQGRAFRVGTHPFLATPRAKTMGETDGLVKVIADAQTDRLLGLLIIGPRASEMIAEGAVAMEFGASAEDLALSSHAHPTLAEAIKEAALAVDKRAIHL